jgi:hypothetical protein
MREKNRAGKAAICAAIAMVAIFGLSTVATPVAGYYQYDAVWRAPYSYMTGWSYWDLTTGSYSDMFYQPTVHNPSGEGYPGKAYFGWTLDPIPQQSSHYIGTVGYDASTYATAPVTGLYSVRAYWDIKGNLGVLTSNNFYGSGNVRITIFVQLHDLTDNTWTSFAAQDVINYSGDGALYPNQQYYVATTYNLIGNHHYVPRTWISIDTSYSSSGSHWPGSGYFSGIALNPNADGYAQLASVHVSR